VVAGPVGVGKSRLLTTWGERSAACTGGMVMVRATASMATIPFGAFAAWVPLQLAGAADRLAVLQAVAASVAGEAERLVVAVDDAHLLDEGSAALVLHLVQHTSLSVVVTVRDGERCPDAVVAVWKEGLGRRIDLRPLSETEAVELVERALDGRFARHARRRVWALSRGNPMYLREVVEAALAQGVLMRPAGEAAEWHWNGRIAGRTRLVELVSDRVGAGGSAERRVLETVALGEPLPVEVLKRLAPAELLAAVETQGLIVVERPPVGETSARAGQGLVVRMAHPLYSEVLRAELPALKVRSLWSALGEAAVTAGADQRDPVRVATWLLDGGAGSSHPDLLLKAALCARFVEDHVLSMRFAEPAERAGAGWRATLVRAIALEALGRVEEAEALLGSLAAPGRDPEAGVAAARVRAEQAFWHRGEALAAVLATVTEAAGRIPAPARSALLSYGAQLALGGLELDESIRLATRAYNDAGSLLDRLHAVLNAGLAGVARGQTRAAQAAVEMARPGAIEALEQDLVPASHLALLYSMASVLDGRVDEAAAFFEQGLERSSDSDGFLSPALIRYWAMKYWAGRAALEQGRLGTAVRLCGDALAALGDRNPYGRGTWVATTLTLAAAQAGDGASAETAVAWMDRHRRPRVERDELFASLARAWLHAVQGELAAARHTAEAAAHRAGAAGAWMIEAIALLHAARLGAAAAVAPRLEQLARVVEGPYVGVAARFARAIAERDGEHLDEVAAAFAALGARLPAAEAAATAATAHATAGRRQRQMASWMTAHELAARCEGTATPLLAELGQGPVAHPLTDREREVTELAASGRTSRDIADALGVSVRTVHSHLHHAYTKLGVSGRGELAALLGAGPKGHDAEEPANPDQSRSG
jgi:DNA-binding CsgD family transcriptional regulator